MKRKKGNQYKLYYEISHPSERQVCDSAEISEESLRELEFEGLERSCWKAAPAISCLISTWNWLLLQHTLAGSKELHTK